MVEYFTKNAIAKKDTNCATCGRAIEKGEQVYTTTTIDREGRDFCDLLCRQYVGRLAEILYRYSH